MRTTIDILEDLLRRAKAEAALRGLRLKDLVRDALRRFLAEAQEFGQRGVEAPEAQRMASDCVLPLFTGPAGPAIRDLRGDGAQRLLDEEDDASDGDPRALRALGPLEVAVHCGRRFEHRQDQAVLVPVRGSLAGDDPLQ